MEQPGDPNTTMGRASWKVTAVANRKVDCRAEAAKLKIGERAMNRCSCMDARLGAQFLHARTHAAYINGNAFVLSQLISGYSRAFSGPS